MNITCYICVFAVIAVSASTSSADIGWADSPSFYLDLLSFTKNINVTSDDSPTFAVNALGIHRGWADSGQFSYNYGGGPQGTPGNYSGILYDLVTGKPIAGATVSIAGKPSVQTDQYGKFTFDTLPSGTITITITKSGYYSVTQQINVGQHSYSFAPITMTPQAGGTAPSVTQLTGKYFNSSKHCYYLAGVSGVIETITATIDWKGKTPKEIKWILPNGTTYTDPVPGNTCSRIFDMGSIGLGKLTLTAIAADSTTSAPKQANFEVIPPPPGIPLPLIKPVLGNTIYYNSAFTFTAINEGVGDNVIPYDIPGFGGKKFECITRVQLEFNVSSDGTASATLKSRTLPEPMKIAGVEVMPKVVVSLTWGYSSDKKLWLPGGSVGVEVHGEYSTPPHYFIIPVGPIPVPAYWRIGLEAAIGFQIALTGWNPDGSPIIKGVVPFEIGAEFMLGVGIADVLGAEGYLGGGANMRLEFPDQNPLKELIIELNGGIRVFVLIFSYENNLLHYEWSLIGKESLAPSMLPMTSLDTRQFQIMPRNYLGPDYAIWQPTPVKQKDLIIFKAESGESKPNEEELLQYNVFDQSQPTLAADGNDLLLAWIYDDPNRTSVNRTKLLFSSCGHGNWSAPVPISDDGTADFSPQIVTFPGGDAICVWENANRDLPNDVNLTDMAAAMEVVASYYDSSSEIWTAYALSNNNHLDRTPRIAAAENNTALAVWIYNAQDDILGSDANALNEIRYARWNGSTWSEPNTVATDIGLIIKTALAYNGSEAVYVYSLDTDHNWQTDSDRELLTLMYDGTTCSGPYQITDDNSLDANPQVTYDQNDILLVWYSDANLVSCRNFDPNTFQQILTASGSSGSMDFRVAKSPTGQISLVWTDTSTAGVDIFTASFDPQLSVWSNAYQLTSDRSMERSIAAAYAGSNELALAYNKVEIIDHNGVPEPNRVDLYVLRHKIKADLAIYSSDISFSVPNPAPGSIVDINAVIHNLGDVAEVNIPVSFYKGDPDAGGLLLKNIIVPGPIPAGGYSVATVSWLVPDTNDPQQIYVVIDRQFSLEDSDRNNNIASVPILAPDLAVAGIISERIGPKMRCITARVTNSGVLPAHNIGVCLRRGSPTGQTLSAFTISELKPGSFYDVWHNWNISAEDFNDVEFPIYAIVDPVNTITEFSENNNAALVSVQVGKSSDLTDDGTIDFTDFAILADNWKDSQSDYSDLAELADNWLWQASWYDD